MLLEPIVMDQPAPQGPVCASEWWWCSSCPDQVFSPQVRLYGGQEHQGAKRRWEAAHLCSLSPQHTDQWPLMQSSSKPGSGSGYFDSLSDTKHSTTHGKKNVVNSMTFFVRSFETPFSMQNNSDKKVKSSKQGHPHWIPPLLVFILRILFLTPPR